MEQVDDDGGEEPGEQGQDVGQPRLAPAQPLLEPRVNILQKTGIFAKHLKSGNSNSIEEKFISVLLLVLLLLFLYSSTTIIVETSMNSITSSLILLFSFNQICEP